MNFLDIFHRIANFRYKDFKGLTRKALKILKSEGFFKTSVYFIKYVLYGRKYFRFRPFSKEEYAHWIKKNEKISPNAIVKEIKNFKYNPKVSIITPVFNIAPEWLDLCVQSVLNQFYPNWELCLYDDASTNKETTSCLKRWVMAGDPRIKIKFGKNNLQFAGASNEALGLATGEFVTFLDNDDKLPPHALFEIVKVLNKKRDLDFIYGDEDKLNEKEWRINPFFKPDWSLDLLLSMNYTSHLSVFRKSIVDNIGGFRKGFEGSQDYDLTLRFIEKTNPDKIRHIPKILYHWRTLSTSTSSGLSAKNYTVDNSIKVLRDYLKRNKIEGEVTEGLSPGRFRVRREIIGNPRVSIIIPFRDQVKILKRCVGSILRKTDYKNYEIVLANNQSQEKETLEYLEILKNDPACRVMNYDKPFNFSAINNYAVNWCGNEYVLFLNNDTEVIEPGWLSAMLEHIQREEVGAVGAKLLYPSGRIQHAGVVLGLGIAGHAFKHLPGENEGYMSQANIIRNCSAVTAACLLTKKSIFNEVGGFDERNFTVAYNDVDLCLRIREKGFLVIYTPYAKLYHHESLSRGDDEEVRKKNIKKYERVVAERKKMFKKWKKWILNDPYYNPNLTRIREDFSLKHENRPPRYL